MILVLSISPLLYFILLAWLRSGLKSPPNSDYSYFPAISIIIAARNEEETIGQLLESLLNQNYPRDNYEIIVANDNSTDATGIIVEQFIKSDSRIKQVDISNTPKGWAPKKWALSQAIKLAAGEIFLFTDADCSLGNKWISSMVTSFRNTQIGIVTGPSPLLGGDGLWDRMLFHDSIGQDSFSAGTITHEHYLTCSGRNFAVRKSAFHEVDGYSQIAEYVSGDDDLLMHKITDIGWKVSYSITPESVVVSHPPQSIIEFITQRLRFASKGKAYYSLPFTPHYLKIVLPFIYVANLSVLLGQILFISTLDWLALIPLGIKIVGDWMIMQKYIKLISGKLSILVLILTELWHSLYIVLFGLAGSFVPIFWKGRKRSPKINTLQEESDLPL